MRLPKTPSFREGITVGGRYAFSLTGQDNRDKPERARPRITTAAPLPASMGMKGLLPAQVGSPNRPTQKKQLANTLQVRGSEIRVEDFPF